MIPSLRQQFNANFTAEKYQRLLQLMAERCGTPVQFRICETPCFFPKSLLDRIAQCGKELIHQLETPEYRQASSVAIPSEFNVPNETSHPMFIQVDFGLVRDAAGQLQPKLVELQGFPSLYAYQPVLTQSYAEVFGLDANSHYLMSGLDWAVHPNWYFRMSKFSLPYLQHECVPKSWFLDRIKQAPADLDHYILKPLFSFAGLGVNINPKKEDLDAIPPQSRSQYILQEKMHFEPVIETPFGATKAEVRIMYIWQDALTPVMTIIRMGRGLMMGVDHNRNMEWVGSSAGFY